MCRRTAGATELSACRTITADPQSAGGMRTPPQTRGPRPYGGAAHPRATKVGTRGDGGGSHRLAEPGREQLCTHNRDPK